VCAIAACVAVGAPAAAQQPSGGPFTGLFRGSPRDQPHTLDLRGSAFTAWDDNLLALTPSGQGDLDPRFLQPGVANGFQGSLAYGFNKSGARSQFHFNGDASVQEFASALRTGAIWFHSYGAATGLTIKATNKTSISVGAAASYAPFYQYAPFLKNTMSEESPVGSDYGFAVLSPWVRSTSASASIENRLSKRSGISAGIGWDQRVIPSGENADLETRTASARFTHGLTRKLAFYIGYGIQEQRNEFNQNQNQNQNQGPVRSHMMDVGLGYGDGVTLKLGRHYTLSASFGASIVKNGDPVSVATTGKSTAFAVNGAATLSRSIGRSWGASLGYLRDTHYMLGFTQLITTDSANAGIGGPLTERLQFSAGAGASRGQQVFSSAQGDLVSYTASTRLSFALFSHLALYGQASYYRFSIPADFANFGFVPNLNRRSASVGLSTWVPLIKPPRQRRDSGTQTPTGQP
jgi:hypothetical protein